MRRRRKDLTNDLDNMAFHAAQVFARCEVVRTPWVSSAEPGRTGKDMAGQGREGRAGKGTLLQGKVSKCKLAIFLRLGYWKDHPKG